MASIIDNNRVLSVVQRWLTTRQNAKDFGELHPRRTLQLRAHEDTVNFISEHLPDAVAFDVPRDLLIHACKQVTLPGSIAEFGVNAGGTIAVLSKHFPDRTVHGFDSFEGLPEDWNGNNLPAGSFTRAGKLPRVASNVALHPGWFDKTVPVFANTLTAPLALIHVDCDLYSSTKTIFDHLGKYIADGTVIVFDEFFNYPNWRSHEFKAFEEFQESSPLAFEFIGYSYEQVAVIARATGRRA